MNIPEKFFEGFPSVYSRKGQPQYYKIILNDGTKLNAKLDHKNRFDIVQIWISVNEKGNDVNRINDDNVSCWKPISYLEVCK